MTDDYRDDVVRNLLRFVRLMNARKEERSLVLTFLFTNVLIYLLLLFQSKGIALKPIIVLPIPALIHFLFVRRHFGFISTRGIKKGDIESHLGYILNDDRGRIILMRVNNLIASSLNGKVSLKECSNGIANELTDLEDKIKGKRYFVILRRSLL